MNGLNPPSIRELTMRYEIYRDANHEWRWRYRALNNKIIAVSSEGYGNKADCQHSIGLIKASADAPIVEM